MTLRDLDTACSHDPVLGHPLVEVVLPAHDEAATVATAVTVLHAYLSDHLPFAWRITVAENASTDGTLAIANRLATELDHVTVTHRDRKGRGGALRAAWAATDADLVAYMDVDLSTGLAGLLPLLAPLISGHSDVAIGSRLVPGARVLRGWRREIVSRCYNLVVRTALRARVRDAQCGFKALRADTARALLARVRDDGWFFDTELLVAAQRAGLRISEIPVDWVDDPDSSVSIVRTALADLGGVARLVWHPPPRRPVTPLAPAVGG